MTCGVSCATTVRSRSSARQVGGRAARSRPFRGTLFAVLSIRDGRKLTKDLRSIFDHLTTKEIGAYPAYLAEVERLISEARESIFIATDFPGHGTWADRGAYGAYVKALENRKADRVRRGHPLNVQLLTLDSAGNLYIATFNDNRVRKISTAGTISTIAGNGGFGYSGRIAGRWRGQSKLGNAQTAAVIRRNRLFLQHGIGG